MAARYNGHRVAFKGEITVSEQAIYGASANVGVQLLNRLGDGRLPVDVHDFAEAMNRCVLVDKTMFIADMLDYDASVVVCCRPRGFGKSMNLSMLRCYLERPARARPDYGLFAGTQIWEAGDGQYRDEYAAYPVILLDLSAGCRAGADAAAVVRDAVARECARLLPSMCAPDLPFDKVRLVERVARGVAGDDEADGALGVLIGLLEAACDEQVVLLVDDYDAARSCDLRLKVGDGARSGERSGQSLFDAIAAAGDLLRLVCLMGERPDPAQMALAQRGVSCCLASPLSPCFDRHFGFSDAEGEALLTYTGHKDCLDQAREWFEGYRFGGFYCASPARVMGYLNRGCMPPVRADLYEYADCLSTVAADWNLERLAALFTLLEPYGSVETPLGSGFLGLDADSFDAAVPDDIWTALYCSGFLTTDMTEEPLDSERPRALRLPNNELRHVLRLVVIEWFECAVADVGDTDTFRDGLCRGDEDAVKDALINMLGDLGVNAPEDELAPLYHLALQGLCFGLPGYGNPTSNCRHGNECWDIHIFPTGETYDVADTIGMQDERPLISINMAYDPYVDALGLELLAVHALLEIERNGIDEIRVPRPGVGRMRWGFGFDGRNVAVVCQRL